MKRYTFTVLLVLTFLVGAPFVYGKMIGQSGKQDSIEAQGEGNIQNDVAENWNQMEEISEDRTDIDGEKQEGMVSEELEVPQDAVPGGMPEGGQEEIEDNVEEIELGAGGEAAGNEIQNVENTNGYEFTAVDRSYFADALFIGDSRTVGLADYADLGEADVFADSGMSVYKIFEKEIQVRGHGKKKLENLLSEKVYGKIYIMLGINELGYDFNKTAQKYAEAVQRIEGMQPGAIIFLGANQHVTGKKSASDPIYNNVAINRINESVKLLADNQKKFYIDVNELFDDANGNLEASITNDQVHVLGKYYAQWADWLCTKGIIK